MTIVGALLQVDLSTNTAPSGHLRYVVEFGQEWGWIALLVLGPLAWLTQKFASWIGRPLIWDTVEVVVHELRSAAFTQACSDDPLHHHRVTLFKHYRRKFWIWPWRGWFTPWGRFRTPWSGWLAPVARSGHTTQNSYTYFLAPDDADQAEGVVGQTWTTGLIVPRLELSILSETSSDDELKNYASQTWVPVQFVRKRITSRKPLPAAICGIPVFVDNKPWGVLVLDSRRPDGIKAPDENHTAFRITQKLLETILEKE